jgi:hypothetical protein
LLRPAHRIKLSSGKTWSWLLTLSNQKNGLLNKKIKPELDQIENKLKSSSEVIQAIRKSSLTKIPSCNDSIYLTEYKLAQKLGKEMSVLVKKI